MRRSTSAGPRSPHLPTRHPHLPDRGHLGPTMFAGSASTDAAHRRGGHRRRRPLRTARPVPISTGRGGQGVASGGVMWLSGAPGAQRCSDDELAAIGDQAHRPACKVTAPRHGDVGVRAAIESASTASSTASLMSEEHQGSRWRRARSWVPTCSTGHGRLEGRTELQGQGGRGVPGSPGSRSHVSSTPAPGSPPAPTRPPSRAGRTGRTMRRWCSGDTADRRHPHVDSNSAELVQIKDALGRLAPSAWPT